MSYRLVRNPAMEKLLLGAASPFAPLYDVEEIREGDVLPCRLLAYGVRAQDAKEIIAKAEQAP